MPATARATSASGIWAAKMGACRTIKASKSGMAFRAQQTRRSGRRSPLQEPPAYRLTHIMEGRKGEKSRELAVYDLEQRRLIDAEITRRTINFMRRSAGSGKPFYVLRPIHIGTLPDLAELGVCGPDRFWRFP
jgi:hypothetical protein